MPPRSRRTGWLPSVLPRRSPRNSGAGTAPGRSILGGMAALVGRSRDLPELDRAVAEARDGQGRLVVVSGPAGIGKSCLVDAAMEIALARGMDVVRGYATDDPGGSAAVAV